MSIEAEVKCVWPARAILGESPCWDRRSGCVFWVDIKGGFVYAFAIRGGEKRVWKPPHLVFSLDTPPRDWPAPPAAADFWFIGCTELGLAWIGIAEDEIILRPLTHPESEQTENRFNDGMSGPDGRYWAGTMHKGETQAAGSLYAFARDGAFERIDAGYIVANGPAFSPDGATLYHTDSARRTIYAFDLDAGGRASARRVFIQFSKEDGCPDGMTTDGEGNLWVAMWDGACIQKLSPSAERLGRVLMPVARPTSCAFVDAANTELFATSAADPLVDNAFAGGLFRIKLA